MLVRQALLLVLVLVVAVLYPAQRDAPGRKYALLVGINEYQHDKLKKLQYAVNDVAEMAKVLMENGYEVTVLSDDGRKPTKANIERDLWAILRECKKSDTILVSFAGHGLQFERQKDCYFCPADARPFKEEVKTLVSLGEVYEEMDRSFAGVKVLLVDACRDDPTVDRASRGIDADSAPRPPRGVAALFSCSAGERAFEHETLKHGVFFHHVLKGLRGEAKNRKGEVTFGSLAEYVQGEVASEVPKLIGGGAKQSPNLKADLSGASPVLAGVAQAPTRPDPVKPPLGRKEPERAKGPFDAKKAKELRKAWADHLGRKVEEEVDLGDGIKMTLMLIPPGTFNMGSPNEELQRRDDESRHEVEITRPFYLAKHEVTQEQYEKLIEKNPSYCSPEGRGMDLVKGLNTKQFPVEMVSWSEAVAFCNALDRKSGRQVALPSEAQWEYACRAGTETPFHFGRVLSNADANINGSSVAPTNKNVPNRTCLVGSYAANAWGLCDMHGNVAEWCRDYYGPYKDLSGKDPFRNNLFVNDNMAYSRVRRGGGWTSSPVVCRSARRNDTTSSTSASSIVGFRVAFLLD